MALETVDFNVRPEDGWVQIAQNTDYLLIRPVDHRPYWIAVVNGGVPAQELEGLKYGRGGEALRQDFLLPTAITGTVFLRIKEPPNSSPASHAAFGVIRDQRIEVGLMP